MVDVYGKNHVDGKYTTDLSHGNSYSNFIPKQLRNVETPSDRYKWTYGPLKVPKHQ